MTTEKKMKNNGKLRQIYMFMLIVGFSLLATVAYFYLNMNDMITTTITNGDFIISASFILFGLVLFFVQNSEDEETKHNAIYTLILVIMTTAGLLLHLFFSKNGLIYVIGKGLTIMSLLSLLHIFLTCNVKMGLGCYIYEKIPVITQKESKKITYTIISYSLVVILLPIIMLQQASQVEMILVLVVFGLFAIIDGAVTYLSFKKNIIIEEEITVDEYRSLILQTKNLSIQNAENEEVSGTLLEVLEQKQDRLVSKELRRTELVELEHSKIQLLEEIAELDRKLSAYDIEELNQRQISTANQMRNTEEAVWASGYKAKYDKQESEWTALQERLQNIQLELQGKHEQLTKNKERLAALEQANEDLQGKQEYQKEQRVTISDMIVKYQVELEEEELEDKEITSISNKIDKLKDREQKTDENIQRNEEELGNLVQQQENEKQLIQALEKAEIPDLTYVITSIQEKMEELVEKLENAKRAYADELLANEPLTELKQLKYSVEQQLVFVAELKADRKERQDIVDIDCLTEIQSIDTDVSDTLNEIAAMYMQDENIQENVTANTIQLEQLKKQKDQLLEEILENKE